MFSKLTKTPLNINDFYLVIKLYWLNYVKVLLFTAILF